MYKIYFISNIILLKLIYWLRNASITFNNKYSYNIIIIIIRYLNLTKS